MTALNGHRITSLPRTFATTTALCSSLALPALAQEGEPILLDEIVVTFTESATGPVNQEVNPLTATGARYRCF